MPIVFGQGMRRSGTTILFDLIWGDGRFRCWYEPLNDLRVHRGGGSRARDIDYSQSGRELRAELAARSGGRLSPEDFAWGAPDHPERELEPGWPPHVRDYVRAMAESAPDVFVKFTRASHKAAELAAIRPDAWFVHLVRDPRAVATSHVLRNHPKHRDRILASGTFFQVTTDFDQWRAESMARMLVAARPDLAEYADAPAYVRCLLLWRELYVRTRDDARRAFGDRYVVVWHDDLCDAPWETLSALYAAWGGRPRLRQRLWAHRHVEPARAWHAPAAPEWDEALRRLALTPLIDEARAEAARGAPA